MKKSYLPLAFAVFFGFTTQHALCMQEELENSKTLIAKLEKLEEKHSLENNTSELFRISSEKEEIKEKLKIEFKKLEIAQKKEIEIHMRLSMQPSLYDKKGRIKHQKGIISDGRDTYELFQSSNDRLAKLVSKKDEIKKALERN
jgi:hypothetical protein